MTLFRPFARWTPVLIAAFVLGACSVEVQFDPTITDTVSAQVSTNPTPRLSDETIAGGATLFYRVDVPNPRDLLYVEADGSDLRITMLSGSGSTIGVSQEPAYFAASAGSLAVATAVAPSEIAVAYACLGPCVATRTSGASVYARIENRSGSSRSFDLFAYTFDHNDTFEPNDSTASAVTLSSAGSVSGAIETLGDVDYFRYTGTSAREIEFDAFSGALGLVLEIDDGPTIASGGASEIFPNERFRVLSDTGRAGPSSTSGYAVTIGDTTSGGGGVDGNVTATTSPSVLLNDVTVAAGATRTYEVAMPAAQRDLFYAEADGSNLRVTIQNASGSRLAVSESPDFFAATTGALGAVSVGPAAIETLYQCIGPCAAVRRTASTYRIVVRNLAGSSRTFDLFAYTFDHNDTFEPNDSSGAATTISAQGVYDGAIETVGDDDWFRYTGVSARSIDFDAFDAALGLELQIEDGPVLGSGDSGVIFSNERFRVRSTTGRAGPPSTSGYAITIGGTVALGAAAR